MRDIAAKNRQVANSYYNLGLEKAKIRDLSGAAQCLKKACIFPNTRQMPEISWV